MKRVLGLVALAVLALSAVVVVNALRFPSLQVTGVDPVRVEVDAGAAAERFAGAIRFPTLSNQDRTDVDSAAFRGLHDYLAETYPRVHESLARETVGGLSLLFTWEGSNPALPPAVLMGHIDVVPVIPGTEGDWDHDPFGGVIADGYVWGRGSMDDKVSVLAVLEAVEALLARDHRPTRTIYLAFGHDEEVGGPQGAGAIAELLAVRGVTDLALVLDEGGALADGLVPGIDGLTAIVGIAEKGFVSLELTVEVSGGHSSMPPPSTAVGILSRAIHRLESDPFPARLSDPVREQFRFMGPEMSFGSKALFANLWLLKPLFLWGMEGSPQTSAMVRTTTAATMFDAGVKDNVLPIDARAVVNFRVLPGETVESVMERVSRTIDDDRITITDVSSSRDPSPMSDPTGPAYRALERSIREASDEPDVVVAPYLVVGGTDAKYYAERSRNVFRFLPARLSEGDVDRFHGTNERMSVESFAAAIRFFQRLIVNADAL